ncbi:hypothetical protein QJQ45_006915 [Haematococcus lacustris]|nr:hypothetical protein QJQ45_006915 [Haematococcus lacustris]
MVSSRRLWLADSGASHHITLERALLHDFRPVNQPVQIVLGKSTDVLCAPDATANHLSTVVADLAGWRVVQEGGGLAGKAHRHVADTLPSLAPPVKGVLDLVHTDVCGPFRVPSVICLRYLLTFLDDFSRMSVVVCLKAKSKVPEAIKATVQWLETQSGRRLKALRSDRGTEFVNGEMGRFCM